MEPASQELIHGLKELRIADERVLQACRSRARRLTRGLPVFDSVWIDALVSAEVLTPFQSGFFENKAWEDLRVGQNIVLTDQLHFDPVMPAFSAVDQESGEKLRVQRVSVTTLDPEEQLSRLKQLPRWPVSGRAVSTHPLQVEFHSSLRYAYLVSPSNFGETLDRLLIRRGRYPEQVVRSIGVGLCERLEDLGSAHVHGDLRLTNVLLTRSGEVLLLNAGVLSALEPVPTIHSRLPHDAYDGLAPERFESGGLANRASEMYAMGCLLWHLLAGRPPFSLADPLAKIAAHRQKSIPDVRLFAPDVSEELAVLLSNLTAYSPQRRPASFSAVHAVLTERKLNPPKRLQSFLQSFESAAPRRVGVAPRPAPKRLQFAAVVCLTILSVLAVWNRDRLGLPQLTEASAAAVADVPDLEEKTGGNQTLEQAPEASASLETVDKTPAQTVPPDFPEPDENGVLQLTGAEEYIARSLSFAGTLRVQGDPAVHTRLVVQDAGVQFEAERIVFENLTIELRSVVNQSDLDTSLGVITDELQLVNCTVHDHRKTPVLPLLTWQAREGDSNLSGRLLISNGLINTRSDFLEMRSPLSTALCQNVLLQGQGAFLSLHNGVKSGFAVPLVLNQSTFVQKGPLVLLNRLIETGRLSMSGTRSLLAMPVKYPLIGFQSEVSEIAWENQFEIAAQDLIVRQNAPLAAYRESPQRDSWMPLESRGLNVNGVLTAAVSSKGPESTMGPSDVPQFKVDMFPRSDNGAPLGFQVEAYRESGGTF